MGANSVSRRTGLVVAAFILGTGTQAVSAVPPPRGGVITPQVIAQRYTKTFLICGEAHPDENYGFADCERQEATRQKAILKNVFSKKVSGLWGAAKEKLENSQRQWLVNGLDTCRTQAAQKKNDPDFSHAGCTVDEIIRRTIWVENYR